MKDSNRVFVTGDIHGNPQLNLSSKDFPEGKDLTKQDVVIILGDFGILWHKFRTKEEDYFLKWLDDKPWTTLFIDGNHENFDILNTLPQKYIFGSPVGIVGHSIFHLKRGFVYRINKRNILALGGAHSHDRIYRKWGESMWKDEEITDDDIERATQSLEKVAFEVDYIMSHCAPFEYAKYAIPKEFAGSFSMDPSEERLSILKNTNDIKFKKWFFGHYHNNIDDPFMNQWTCLYDKVMELE